LYEAVHPGHLTYHDQSVPVSPSIFERKVKAAGRKRLKERRHVNVAAVALAARHARGVTARLHGATILSKMTSSS
jgi:hypothetical protein